MSINGLPTAVMAETTVTPKSPESRGGVEQKPSSKAQLGASLEGVRSDLETQLASANQRLEGLNSKGRELKRQIKDMVSPEYMIASQKAKYDKVQSQIRENKYDMRLELNTITRIEQKIQAEAEATTQKS